MFKYVTDICHLWDLQDKEEQRRLFLLHQGDLLMVSTHHLVLVQINVQENRSHLTSSLIKVQCYLTYPDTFVPNLTVRITEFPDKWITIVRNGIWFPNRCPDKWALDKWGSTLIYIYFNIHVTIFSIHMIEKLSFILAEDVNLIIICQRT